MKESLNELEQPVMDALLSGDDPRLATLRGQLPSAVVTGRELTGAGFLTRFSVPAAAARVGPPIKNPIDDVCAELAGEENAAGFLLWLEDGALQALEGFSYGGVWPEEAQLRRIFYVTTEPGGRRIETGERELEEALEPDPA
jgi:hypothetical protein